MADKETDAMNIIVRAEADEKSPKEAVDALTSGLQRALKDGYIEIPVELNTDVKNGSDQVLKAQDEFRKAWKKQSKKGFSSSGEEFDDFINKALKFRRAMNKDNKAGSAQARWMRNSGFNDLIDSYNQQVKSLRAEVENITKTTRRTRTRSTTSSRRRTPMSAEEKRRQRQEENESVTYAINERNGINRFTRNLSRHSTANRNPTVGEIALGLRQPTLGNSDFVTSRSIKDSGRSPYQNYWGIMNSQLEKDSAKLARRTFKSYKLDPQSLFEKNREIESNPNRLEQQQNRNRSAMDTTLLDSVKTTLKDITKGDLGLEQLLGKIIDANIARGQELGESSSVTANKIADKIMTVFHPKGDRIGSTDGTSNADLLDKDEIRDIVKKALDKLGKQGTDACKEIKDTCQQINRTTNTTSISSNRTINREINRLSDNTELTQGLQALNQEQKRQTTAVESQNRLSIMENSAERISDNRENQSNREAISIAKADANTGFNTESNAKTMFAHIMSTNRLLGEVKGLLSQIFNLSGGNFGNGGNKPPTTFNNFNNSDNSNDPNSIGSYQSILLQITQHLKNIDVNVGNILQSIISVTGKIPNNLPAIIDGQGVKTYPSEREPITDKTDYTRLHDEKVAREVEAERTAAEVHNWVQKYVEADRKKNAQQRLDEAARKGINQVDTSRVITPTAPESFWSRLQSALTRTVSESEADRIMKLNRAQQARMRAQRLEIFGENTGRNLTDTGDKASVKRTKQLFGWIYKNDGTNKELFQDVRLTPGFNKEETVNTTKILDSLNRVLSGPEMFKAQTGGTLRNILGSFTGYIGMPSLEKSRVEAEGLNQVMANVRNEVLKLIQAIQAKEMSLKSMQEMGTAKFDSQGMITTDSSSAAQKTFIDLEEQKGVLRGALAEVQMIDAVVGSTGGKISQIVKKLGFVMPELMENNTILQNINAGLDKNGKALKFQTRTGEILNYSFQLMSRHIGQMVKNWLWMINPINLLKRAFQDFASYDVKWQRTMNVIKYNLRRIIKPFMEWLAQQIVNIIGLVNSLLKGIGSIFGKNWDLFDQDAANSEKIKENLEEASQVSAGFDELHDIGSDTSDSENSADNLLGEIYTPEWDSLNKALEKIGETVGNIIKTVQGWDFWDWLALAGAALLGFLALKTLINWFSGKNPLQSVANGFKALQTTVGWAILIAAFALFTNTLKDFITTIGEMDPWAVVGALSTLAAGFGILVGAIILLSKWATSDWKALLGMSVLVGVFTGLTAVLIPFINTLKEVTSEQLLSGLLFFAGALMAVTVAVGALATIFTAIATTGIGLAALGILAGVLAVVALVIAAMADYIRAIGEAGEGIKSICEGIATVVESVGTQITKFTETVGTNIVNITDAVSNGIKTVLEPILAYLDKVTDKITDLAKVIAHEIGETIRTVIETTGDTIVRIIETLLDAIPRLLNSILNFAGRIGPAIETSVNSIMNSVTKLINFVISGVEYLINLVVTGINGIINSINSVSGYVGISIPNVQPVEIPRFYPQYEQGTNYVPNDGLAYLHQGEAVIPKKYNKPFEAGLTTEERNYMYQMIGTLRSLDNTMKQGISVNGQFVQRGSDLVAVVNKTNSRTGADLLSNVAYAR